MKICLLRPNRDSRFQISPPLSLGYLSSALKKNGYTDIYLVDGSLSDFTPLQAARAVISQSKTDLIGIQVYTGSHNWVKEFVMLAKQNKIDAKIICGGPHISALGELALKYIDVDYGVLGEGENSIVDFVKYLDGKINNPLEVEGLLFKNGDKFIYSKTKYGFLKDINDVAHPDWDLLQPQKYFDFKEGASVPLKGKRATDIITSRGCPYKCTFCSSGVTSKRIIRYRKAENIISELKFLTEKYSVDEIFFSDDNLTMDLRRAEELFDLMIQSNLKIHWRAPNGIRIDRLNPSLVKKMAKSGGYYVGVGIESGNRNVLKRIKKQLDLGLIPDRIKLLRKNGFYVSGFFMCGMLGETLDEINDSIRFSLKIPFSRIQVSNYVPYPGSEDFDTIFQADNKELFEQNVMRFQKDEYIPKFQELRLDQIYKIQRNFMLKFYLRPRIIISLLLGMRFSQIKAILSHPWIKMWFSKAKKWYSG